MRNRSREAIELFKIIAKLFFIYYSNYNKIILIGFWGLGDICYELTFIDDFKEKVKKPIVVLSSKKNIFLFKLYKSVNKVIQIADIDYLRIIKFSRLINKFFRNFNRLVNVYVYSKTKENKNIFTMLEENIFGFKPKKLTFPDIPLINEKILHNNFNFLMEKFVILNIHSNSLRNNDLLFFKKAIKYFNKKNITVINNFSSLFLPGTININCSPIELYNLSKFSLLVLSIRSGILDFIITSNVSIFAIYPNNQNGKDLLSRYSLKDWNQNIKLLETIADTNCFKKFKKFCDEVF
jgi:hypothetical protein